MIDLSFLTEDEQMTILAVLKRDAGLKKAEEERIKHLQRTVRDKGQLKYMTGQWFYETKSLRHQERIHGADILWASMKQSQKPLTILELSQMWPEKPSFVASDNRDVFIPPVLSGLILDPRMNRRDPNPHETQRSISQSPTKQRRNPFNTEPEDAGEELLTTSECTFHASNTDQDNASARLVDDYTQPVPKNSGVIISQHPQESQTQPGSPEGSQGNSATPRGILKFTSCSGSSPEEEAVGPVFGDPPHESPPVGNEDNLAGCLDRKQVRFCPAADQSSGKRQDGVEPPGVHNLLDVDLVSPAEDNGDSLVNSSSATADMRRPLVKQTNMRRPLVKQTHVDAGICGPQHAPSDKYERGHAELLSLQASIHSAEHESGKPFHGDARPEEEVRSYAKAADWLDRSLGDDNEPQPKLHPRHIDTLATVEASSDIKIANTVSSQNPFHAVSPMLLGIFTRDQDKEKRIESPDKQELSFKQKELDDYDQCAASMTHPPGVKQAANHPGKSKVRALHLTAQKNTPFKDATASHSEEPTKHKDIVSPMNTEKGKRIPEIIFTRHPTTDENNLNAESATPHDPQQFHIDPIAENGFLFEPIKNDGTYKVCPDLTYEDTDDSSADKLIHTPVSPVECVTPSIAVPNEDTFQVSIIDQYSLQDNISVKISDRKCFWELEYSGPSITVGKPKETSVSPTCLISGSIGSTEKNVEPQCSSSKLDTKKGFVTHNKSQSSSLQLKTKTEPILPMESSLCPSRSPTPRSKHLSDDELKRDPSKTCHLKALARESSSSKWSRLEESPLKTFPIDIAPPLKHHEYLVRPTPVPRQRKGPSDEAKQLGHMDIEPVDCEDVNLTSDEPKQSGQMDIEPEDCEDGNLIMWNPSVQVSQALTQADNSKCSSLGKGDSDEQEELGYSSHLAKSFITQDSRQYLGAPKKAYVPLFYQDVTTAESDVSRSVPASVHDADPQRTAENVTDDPSRDQTSMPRSWARSGSFKNESSPSRGALKRMSSRPMSSSKSLENLSSQTTREEKSKTSPTGQMGLLSVDDDPERIKKMSTSVPALQEEEIDSDSTFDINTGRRRITLSSTSMSQSSGMVSMSSVSGSMSSLYPADLGNVEVRGSIQFAVNYVQKLAEFHIFVVHCRDLAIADPKKNRSDPYVKCYLLPDQAKLGKRKTSVKKKTLNPTYNEILRFKIAIETLKALKLSVSVWHNDTFGRNSFLGEVDLDLSEWDFSNTQMNDYFLKSRLSAPSTSRSNFVDMRGQMRVALRFLPQTSHSKRTTKMETGEVQIWVKDCKNLPAVRGMSIDPFVKCTMLPDTSRKVIQKTRVVKRSASPMFNHTMVYDGLRPEDLREACAEITVWDQDKLTTHYIGGLRLGLGTGKSYGVEVAWMDSTTEESNLWERMMQSNGDWVEGVLSLRMLVLAKSMSK